MSNNKDKLPFLVAALTAGCAVLALTSAIISRDQTALSQLFTTANGLFNVGAGAIIGLLAPNPKTALTDYARIGIFR